MITTRRLAVLLTPIRARVSFLVRDEQLAAMVNRRIYGGSNI
jgi:hypothetical protein